jgi:hypothetical protein
MASAAPELAGTNLRRAVSTCYYALFHSLAHECAERLVGGNTTALDRLAWRQVYRGLDHGPAKEKCRSSAGMESFSDGIRVFANSFVEFQSARHNADYDPFAEFAADDVAALISEAEGAIDALRSAPEPDRRAFCAYVLFRDRR